MALDEPNASDDVFDIDGYQYVVNKELLERAKPVKVDFVQIGFKIDCNLDFGAPAAGCSGCGTTSTCCS